MQERHVHTVWPLFPFAKKTALSTGRSMLPYTHTQTTCSAMKSKGVFYCTFRQSVANAVNGPVLWRLQTFQGSDLFVVAYDVPNDPAKPPAANGDGDVSPTPKPETEWPPQVGRPGLPMHAAVQEAREAGCRGSRLTLEDSEGWVKECWRGRLCPTYCDKMLWEEEIKRIT
jgi:hypothetical protein